jgi:hypothetical protein
MLVKITDCFLAPAYHQVCSEEGRYDAHCGWNVLASSTDERGYRIHWLYVGRKENPEATSHPAVVFGRESAAQSYADHRIEAGEIDDRYWWDFDSQNPNDLPDYVLHPERPEYN